jgi:hypothetical protein
MNIPENLGKASPGRRCSLAVWRPSLKLGAEHLAFKPARPALTFDSLARRRDPGEQMISEEWHVGAQCVGPDPEFYEFRRNPARPRRIALLDAGRFFVRRFVGHVQNIQEDLGEAPLGSAGA